MNATVTNQNPLQLEVTKAKIVGLMIAAGTTLSVFGSYGMIRHFVFTESSAVKPPAGLHERAPQSPESGLDGFVVATPQPTIDTPSNMVEYPVPTATAGGNWDDTNEDLDAIWKQRNNGALPPVQTIPGCSPCPEPQSRSQGFKTGQGSSAANVGIGQVSGYTTSSGMREGSR